MVEELALQFERGLGEEELAAEFALELQVGAQQLCPRGQVVVNGALCGDVLAVERQQLLARRSGLAAQSCELLDLG